MKRITSLSLTLSVLSLLGLQSPAQACNTVKVYATDTTGKGGTLVLTLDSNPVEFRNVGLLAGGTRVLDLSVGPLSASSLTLKAQVSQDTLLTTCEIPVNQCAEVDLTIAMTTPQTCSPPPEEETCKHDNGNHWGEYRKLGMVVPPHSGKPNATKPCKGNKSPGTTPASSGQTCPPQLNCHFTPKTVLN